MTETATDAPLDAREIALIRESFAKLDPRVEDASLAFYAALFTRKPDYRRLFREDLEGQGMRFMSAIRTILENADHPREASAEIARLGQGHAAFGLTAEHFDTMREALIETLGQELGEDFTPETEAAWRKGYDAIARAMMAAA